MSESSDAQPTTVSLASVTLKRAQVYTWSAPALALELRRSQTMFAKEGMANEVIQALSTVASAVSAVVGIVAALRNRHDKTARLLLCVRRGSLHDRAVIVNGVSRTPTRKIPYAPTA
jgi:hypothetical protein